LIATLVAKANVSPAVAPKAKSAPNIPLVAQPHQPAKNADVANLGVKNQKEKRNETY